MKSLYPLHGIVAVLNTPFTSSGSLDLTSLRNHVRYAMNAGVKGFLVPAMASEVTKLSHRERILMVETTLDTTNGIIPVIAGVSEESYTKGSKLLKSYLKLGCKEVLFQIPFHNEKQFKTHFLKLCDFQPEVIMLQDWDNLGYGLPDSLILELFNEVKNFRCLKIEVVPASLKYSTILKLTNEKLIICGGWAVNHMIEGLQRGVHAFMPTGMPYIYTQIYQYYISGNYEEAEQLFSEILPVLAFSNQYLDISIQFFKRLLFNQNLYKTSYVRQPTLSYDEIFEQRAIDLINKVISLENYIIKSRSGKETTSENTLKYSLNE